MIGRLGRALAVLAMSLAGSVAPAGAQPGEPPRWSAVLRGHDGFYFVEETTRIMNWTNDGSGLRPSASVQTLLLVSNNPQWVGFLQRQSADCVARTIQILQLAEIDAEGRVLNGRVVPPEARPVTPGGATEVILERMCTYDPPANNILYPSVATAVAAARQVLAEDRPG